jgi:hypothetical protein
MTTFIADLIFGRLDRPARTALSALTRLAAPARPEAGTGGAQPRAARRTETAIDTGPQLARRPRGAPGDDPGQDA